MFRKDRRTVVVSSKEKDKSIILGLIQRGWDVVVRNTITADYQILGLPGGLRIERKKDISELIKSLGGSFRYNTEGECWRAYFDGTPLVYVISEKTTKSGKVINTIWDLMDIKRSDLRPENMREDIQTAVERMQEFVELYDIKFKFVEPEDMLDTIERLLIEQPWTIHEKKTLEKKKLTDEELLAVMDEIEQQEAEYDQIE